MVKVIGVKFRNGGRVYFFDPEERALSVGDGVIVETARGLEYGDVTMGVTEVEEGQIVAPLKPVSRVATEEDRALRRQYMEKEAEAFEVCQQKIQEHGLDMRLVRAEYAFNGSKLVFYFTADERVDFRSLVKDLAFVFKTRIELRQIGVRDEAKMLGGLGPCGRPVCCKQFLDDFRPVSIKMAKEQGLSLSPTKISGLCGRLMCCLQYEQCCYEQMHKCMPRMGKEIETPDGVGVVVENNVITERTKVKLTGEDGSIDLRTYAYQDLGPGARERAAAAAAELKTAGEDEAEGGLLENASYRPAPSKPRHAGRSGSQGEQPAAQKGEKAGESRQQPKPAPQKESRPSGKSKAEASPAAPEAGERPPAANHRRRSNRRRSFGPKKPTGSQQG